MVVDVLCHKEPRVSYRLKSMELVMGPCIFEQLRVA